MKPIPLHSLAASRAAHAAMRRVAGIDPDPRVRPDRSRAAERGEVINHRLQGSNAAAFATTYFAENPASRSKSLAKATALFTAHDVQL
jgi:hypothetical protein